MGRIINVLEPYFFYSAKANNLKNTKNKNFGDPEKQDVLTLFAYYLILFIDYLLLHCTSH